MVGQTLNQYLIRAKLGAGGMGEVYRAWDQRLERDVALKLLSPESLADQAARRAFRQEALSLSKLNHPNIATIHDFHSHQGADYLVMELIQGQTLTARMESGPLSEIEISEIGSQIASALEEAHESGIIHRDLKPANIMISLRGQVKVLDFGIARLFGDVSTDSTATLTGHGIVGTLHYMSPEHLRGERLDPRSDIYSLGVVLYEAGCGFRPFRKGTNAVIASEIMSHPPQRPSELNPAMSAILEGIVLRCLEKNPDARFQTARELRRELGLLGSPRDGATEVLRTRVTVAYASRKPAAESLVVLPAKVFAGPADAFLADAMPSLLSTYLNQVDGLETKVPPTSAEVEPLQGDLSKVAEAYNVKTLVVSFVTVTARRLTYNVQLVEAGTRRLIWSHEYQGVRSRYQNLLRDAADGIRQALCPAAHTLPAAQPLTHVERDLLVQRGLYHSALFLNRGRKEDFDAASEAFTGVHKTTPGRSDVAAEMARLHLARFGSAPVEEFAPVAQKWALQALETDPHCARGWAVLATLETADYRRKLECALKGAAFGGRDAFCQVQLTHAIARSSYVLSLEASRQASSIDPLMVSGPIAESLMCAGIGRRGEAIERIDRALRIEPDNPVALFSKAQILVMKDEGAQAAALLSNLETHVSSGRLRPEWFSYLKDLIALLDGSVEAGTRLEAAAMGHAPFPRWEVLTSGFAAILARSGAAETAFRIIEARNRLGLIDTYDYLLYNPDFAALRSDPRFSQLAAPARMGFETMTEILREAQLRGEFPAYLERPLAEIQDRISVTAFA